METKDYLDYLVRVIHTAIVATVDEEGLPVTAAIDMMDTDGDSLYFMTAKGKSLYDRLQKRPFLALTGLWGDNTMTRKALSIRGKVRELGEEKRSDLFRKNRYMWEIYPTEISQKALSVFQIYEGRGEWFDLSKKPVERDSFTFGGGKKEEDGYFITDRCVGCGKCVDAYPQHCIFTGKIPFRIVQEHCLRCGNCRALCPAGAVERRCFHG